MTLIKLRAAAVVMVVLILAVTVIWQHQRAKSLLAEHAVLREQIQQVASQREENQHLTEQLKAADQRSQEDLNELRQLRSQAGMMPQMEQENARLKDDGDTMAKPTPQMERMAAVERVLGHGAIARMDNGRRLGLAVLEYASENQGQFPPSFQEAARFLSKDEGGKQAASSADQYEMLYQGQLDDITNPPPEAAIIIREKQPWLTPEGTWARTYVYGDGHAFVVVEPDGHFDNWETLRIQKPSGQ